LALGAIWGIGHTAVLRGAGVLVVLLGVEVPAGFERWAELAVAAMLIALGARHLRGRGASTHAPHDAVSLRARPLVIGMVHGLAGSGGVALLALTTIPARASAMIYLGLFALGTVAGMMALTGLLSLPLRYAGRSPQLGAWLVRAASVASLGMGLLLAVRCSLSF
ncbi:MAG: high-affinity nickel-transport family protein, partial [Polyangiaceae bacterium]